MQTANKICFDLGGMYEHIPLFTNLININKTNPDLFYDNYVISSVHGTFPFQCWNGGRYLDALHGREMLNTNQIKEFLSHYNDDLGVAVKFTYTNQMIKLGHLSDMYCNLITKLGNNNNNYILCNSELLEKYLRTNFQNYKYMLSTTKSTSEIDKVNELTKIYDIVVLDYNLSNSCNIVDIADKNKVEILINESCVRNCPYRYEHYKTISQEQLTYPDLDNTCKCKNPCSKTFQGSVWELVNSSSNNTLSIEYIRNFLIPKGFTNFKICGREFSWYAMLETILYYMVKPEWIDELRYSLIMSCIGQMDAEYFLNYDLSSVYVKR